MKIWSPISTTLLIILFTCNLCGADKALQAIGFADNKGGTGGKIIRVTNLKAKGPGSFRAAIESKEPRIVIFEVGGVIDLQKASLKIRNPFITIAGQTAPSPGITLIRGPLYISTHDVLIQHIRVRPGDAGQPKKSGWEPDGISTSGGNAYNIIVDHCSISWATDENLSASGSRTEGPEETSHRVTFSNCIIAEGLNKSTHAKGPHSKGSLIHDFCQDIAVIGNLYAHNVRRNPYFKAHATGVIVNNVIYNPGRAAIQLNYSDSEWKKSSIKPINCRVSIVGNVLIHGADTRKNLALTAKRGDAYMADNQAFDINSKPSPLVAGKVNILKDKPIWPKGLKPLPSKDIVNHVIRHAGARPTDRDDTDKRIINDFKSRKGRIIDSQDEVGGYPETSMTTRKLTVPSKNISSWLEKLATEVE
ncbi:MAG: right-handed parallel beta-helix repeat-containing protein [Kiritimatiellae bacterium]|jgi:hypothetical protein|nr:right-handed parallel beta-helix repeat-containing protein [Kiritimatiellia bacterium]